MGAKRERNRIRCRVDDFPEAARLKLEALLRDVHNTYEDIAAEMTEAGYEISKSAVHRYAMRTNAAASRVREAAEQTRMLVQELKDNQDLEATEVATAILMDGLTRRLATAEDDFDNLPLEKAGRLLVQIQRSAVYKDRYKKDRQKTIDSLERNIMERLRELAQEDSELLDKLMALVATAAKEEAAKEDG